MMQMKILVTQLLVINVLGRVPPFWNITNNLHTFDKDSDGKFIVDAFHYEHRLALYHELLSSNEHCLWNTDLEDEDGTVIEKAGSPIWGLIIQHGWQFNSDRLCIPHDASKGFVFESDCWWGCGNYFFSLVTYFAAEKAGLVPPIKAISRQSDQDFLCHSLEECLEKGGPTAHALNQWAELFEYLKETKDDCKEGDLPDPKSHFMDQVLKTYWSSHVSSIAGVAQCGDPSHSYDKVEAKYGNSWVTIVQMLADIRFNVNYTETILGQVSFLPPRLLEATDKPGFIPDMNLEQNFGIAAVEGVYELNKASRGWLEKGVEVVACSPEGRESIRNLITIQNVGQLFGNLTAAVDSIWSKNKDCHNDVVETVLDFII